MTERILVIDDSIAVHRLLMAHLVDEQVELHSAYAGDAGLKAAVTLQPDLILLDVDLPGLDGFDVCARLKADSRTIDIPVLFLTGSDSVDEKIRGLELGAMDYVTKPFVPAELRARVRASLRTKRLADLLSRTAQIDGLTTLWNRTHFDNRMAQEASLRVRSPAPLACIMLDVDHFKSINDRFGHPAGDDVLRAVSRALLKQTRTEDCVCRYGGEEFVIITPGVDGEGAEALAERLRRAIAEIELTQRGERINVTASFGVSGCSDLDNLIGRADEALFRAKRAGRNCVVLAEATTASGCAGV